MKTTTLDLLCHPLTHDSLQLTPDHLLKGKLTGETYAIRDGIPLLLPGEDCTGLNKQYQKLYDRIALRI
jgi:uncharacterized protein YbaR (Trm112 family)